MRILEIFVFYLMYQKHHHLFYLQQKEKNGTYKMYNIIKQILFLQPNLS